MTKKQLAPLFLVFLAATTVYELSLSDQHGGLGSCGGDLSYSMTVTLHPPYAVGSPLFSVPQLVVPSGSATNVTVVYYNYG